MTSEFSLKQAQLRGFSFYETRLQEFTDQTKQGREGLRTQFRCTAVVLVLLALLAAGGSAALMVMSHGPYHNLPYFVSGAGVGLASLGLLVWLAISYVYSSRKQAALQNALNAQEEKSISFIEVLPKMTQADPQAIKNVLGKLEQREQRQLVTKTYEAFFGGDNPQPLSPEQKKVVNALTHCEEALVAQIKASDRNCACNFILTLEPGQLTNSIIKALATQIGEPMNEQEANWLFSYAAVVTDAKDKDRDFGVLKYVSPNPEVVPMSLFIGTPSSEDEAQTLLRHPQSMAQLLKSYPRCFALALLKHAPTDHSESVLLDALFAKVGEPLSKDEAKILARHPQALLRVMAASKEDGLIAGYPRVVASLAHKHPLIFTPEILMSIYQKMDRAQKTEFLNQMGDVRDHQGQTQATQQVIAAAVQPLISLLMKDVIARSDPSKGSGEYMNLLVAMGKWPEQAAKSLFETGFVNKSSQKNELSALSALYSNMQHQQQALFKVAAVTTLSSRSKAAEIYPPLITLANINRELKEPLFAIMAQTPRIMAQAMNIGGVTEALEIRDIMSESDQDIYRRHFMKIYAGKSDFEETLTADLLHLQQNPAEIRTSYALAYLNQFPEKFTIYVLDSEPLGDDAARGQLALNLLEQMDEKQSEHIIETMDGGLTMGYPYYNYLTNLLILEAEKMAGTSIPASRARLMARFAFAQDKGKKIMELTRLNTPIESSWLMSLFGGKLRLLLKVDHPGWVQFSKAAESQATSVYQKN